MSDKSCESGMSGQPTADAQVRRWQEIPMVQDIDAAFPLSEPKTG